MNRSVLPVLLLAIFAGAAAGAAVSLTLKSNPAGPATPSAPAAGDARLSRLGDTVAALELRLEEMELANSDLLTRVNVLEESEAGMPSQGPRTGPGMVGQGGSGAPSSRSGQIRMGGAPFVAFGSVRGAPLAGLSEEEKWLKLREELALDSYQESELKRIRQEMQTELKDIFKIDPETGTLAGRLDVQKMMEARRSADEKVKNLLSEQQYEKYRKEGYGSALGMGGGVAVSYTSISTPRERRGK